MAKQAIVKRNDIKPSLIHRLVNVLALRKAKKLAKLLAMEDVEYRIRHLKVGANTITANPSGGPGDVFQWSAAQSPDTILQLGMSTAGRPMGYVGGAKDSIMVGDDHGLIGGLTDDDHTQYTLADGTRAFSGNQAMGSNKITGLGAPTDPSDAARLADVTGLATQQSVDVATQAALPAYTQVGAGVGATLTATSVGILTVDGVATVLADRILVNTQNGLLAHADHGIYEVTIEGTAGVAFELTRATDYDGSIGSELASGDLVPIREGTVGADTIMIMATDESPVTPDTTAFVFTTIGVQISDHGALTGLTDDDHSQYPLLIGRTSGQSVSGGIAASENLLLQSTTNATKGMVGPVAHNTDDFGATGTRWKNAYFVNSFSTIATMGDQLFANNWGWTEDYKNDGMVMYDSNKEAVMAIYSDGIYHRKYGWKQKKGFFGKRRIPVYTPAEIENPDYRMNA